jgi:putative N6-adenine-specific DNA methylase
MVPRGTFDMVAKTQAGFEEVLGDELWALGAEDIRVMRRAVAFRGDRALLYRANLWLRSALRVLIPIQTAIASNADSLYARALQIDWSAYLTPEETFAIDCTTSGDLHPHSLFAAMRVKDAIADQFMEKQGVRPSVDLAHPTLRINVHINDADVIFALDSSGESLHKRGYRLEKNDAPLNEVMAAGMLLLTQWDGKSNFGDLMCGSGTLLIEGAWIAKNIAPGLCREGFGFQQWRDFDAHLWELMVAEARAQVRHLTGQIFGSDISAETIELAQRNIQRAGLEGMITLTVQDFRDARPPGEGGLIVTNPPYGERLEVEEIDTFYAELGDVLKQHCKGYDAWILSGNIPALKRLGLRASKKIPLFNASIECRFHKFELYAGTRERKV